MNMTQAQAIASDYNAYFSVEPTDSLGQRTINHPGFIYLIDPNGQLRLVYSGSELDLERMILDLNHLIREFS